MRRFEPHGKAGIGVLDIMCVSHWPGQRLVRRSLTELQLDLLGPTRIEEMRNSGSVHFYLFVLFCGVLVVNICAIGTFSREETVDEISPVGNVLVFEVLQN